MLRHILLRSTVCCCLLALPVSLRAAAALALPRPEAAPFAIQMDGPFPGGHYSNLLPSVGFGSNGADGGYVAVWTRSPGGQSDVVARLFDGRGKPRSPVFAVSAASTPNVYAQGAQVAMLPAGGFVVVWMTIDLPSSTIQAQLFTAGGARSGGPIQVSAPGQSASLGPAALGVDQAGAFAVAFVDDTGVSLRRFSRHGAALGPAVSVSGTAANAVPPTLAMQPDGNVVLAWSIFSAAGIKVVGQRFDPAGEVVGEEFQVNAGLLAANISPAAAATADGGFVVTSASCPLPANAGSCTVLARFYDAAANPQTGDLAVSTAAAGYSFLPPAVAADARGNVLIAWQSCAADANCVLGARAYDPQGEASPDVAILATADNMFDPTVAAGPAGFLVAYHTVTCSAPGCDTELTNGVFGWRFDLPPSSAATSTPAPGETRAAVAVR